MTEEQPDTIDFLLDEKFRLEKEFEGIDDSELEEELRQAEDRVSELEDRINDLESQLAIAERTFAKIQARIDRGIRRKETLNGKLHEVYRRMAYLPKGSP